MSKVSRLQRVECLKGYLAAIPKKVVRTTTFPSDVEKLREVIHKNKLTKHETKPSNTRRTASGRIVVRPSVTNV